MSENLSRSAAAENVSMESRLIYSNTDHFPGQTFGIINRNDYGIEKIDFDNQEYFAPEVNSKSNRVIKPQEESRQNYDPWRDIYLKGTWNPAKLNTPKIQKSDRRSTNYFDYDDYANNEDEVEDQFYLPIPQKKKSPRYERLTDSKQRAKPRPTGAYEYEDPDSYENSIIPKDKGSSHPDQVHQTPSLTRRVTDVLSPFSGGILTVIAVLAVPFLIAAGYWLLVVNGPTPVVKARIDDPDFDGKISFEEESYGLTDSLEAFFRSALADLKSIIVNRI